MPERYGTQNQSGTSEAAGEGQRVPQTVDTGVIKTSARIMRLSAVSEQEHLCFFENSDCFMLRLEHIFLCLNHPSCFYDAVLGPLEMGKRGVNSCQKSKEFKINF